MNNAKANSDKQDIPQNVDVLINRFSTLVESTQKIIFPPLERGIAVPPDRSDWSKLRQIMFFISSPYPSTSSNDDTSKYKLLSLLMLLIWMLASLVWFILADYFIDAAFGVKSEFSSTEPVALMTKVIGYLLLVLAFVLILPAYWSWIEFLRNQKIKVFWRVVLPIIFVGIAISFPYWGFESNYLERFPEHIIQNKSSFWLLMKAYFFLLPLGTFWFMLLIESVVLIMSFILNSLRYLAISHDPLPKDRIKKVLANEIHEESDSKNGSWKLLDMSPDELQLIQSWAEANREGTDKRLLPTAIIFGVIGIFANTETFSKVIEGFLKRVSVL
jgi:hypothetical protein